MGNAYAYIENEEVIIGNDYLERRFSTKGDKLITTEIVNKRIPNKKQLVLKKSSAEFYIGFREKKILKYTTYFVSSNELTLDSVNVLKHRVEFVFKPYSYRGVKITFIINVEIADGDHFMRKYIEMMVDPEQQHLITIDYIDCEHINFETPEQQWTVGKVERAHIAPYYAALGQPFYLNGLFFGCEFPLTENQIEGSTAHIRYFSGKRFDTLKLNCGHTFRTWNTVVGAARGLEQEVIREDFLAYIRTIARDINLRFQYNSWYDHMLDITNENITKSFMEIEKNLSGTLVPPLDSYVVDDGFADYKKDFWAFNSKFPNELYPASSIANKLASHFGLWLGPRGGYSSETPKFARAMERSGNGGYNRAANDVCVSHPTYIKKVTQYFIESMDKFDINYWKLDGFLLAACPNKKHGHICGGYQNMYQFTEMWENWIDVFRKIRLHRESAGKDLWINQTSYCNASPWFLQWADSLWIQNSCDMGFLTKTNRGEKLGARDIDKLLSYRDERYYDFAVKRNYQFPLEYLYNHDPIYGNSAKISMTDEEYRNYMFMMATRGTAFWELYYSYNMFSPAKWRINADALRFIRDNHHILKTARFIGASPATGGIYGYSAWTDDGQQGIVSLRNPANREQKFVLALDKTVGTPENSENMQRVLIYPYTKQTDESVFSYGDTITVTLPPLETVIMKFSSVVEYAPALVYGRFNSQRELLLFFDDRIYFERDMISSDKRIESVQLLEDYSTLKIIFADDNDSVFVSMNVKNAFGDVSSAEWSGKYYPDFVCDENTVPNGRDFTVGCTVKNADDGVLLSAGDDLSVSLDGAAVLRFRDAISRGTASVKAGDRLALVCEPNGLIKLYINGALECSAYSEGYNTGLAGCGVTLSDNADALKLLAKALPYDEAGEA